jgi:hypothetical protein
MKSPKPLAFLLAAVLIAVWFTRTVLADPNPSPWENWKTDFSKTNIPFNEVMSGGPPKDGIPAIDEPLFVTVEEASLDDREPVIGFEYNGDARAYPLSILMWHEIANDIVGGHPFAVTYCPLCNAAIVFDAEIGGTRHTFGTTGRLRNSDLLMYDRVTESWWQQFSGEAVIGNYTGRILDMIPSRLESFASFSSRHPNGKVLIPNDPDFREYGRNPYVGYDSRDAPYPFFTGEMPEGINPMARVIILRREGEPVAVISFEKARAEGPLEFSGFRIEWQAGRASALDAVRVSNGREIGNLIVTNLETGADAAHDLTFAFVAHAFHPELAIVK